MRSPVCVMAFMLMLLMGSFAVGAQERPHDPWVFYSVLEGGPTHALVIALHEELWVIYDFRESTLFRAFKGRVDISDPTAPNRYSGTAYMERVPAPTWRVFESGAEVPARAVYRGHRFEDGYVRLMYSIILVNGAEIRVSEMVDVLDRPGESLALIRLIETADVPEGVELMLTLPRGSAVSRIDSTVPIEVYGGFAAAKLLANGGSIITTHF